LLHEYDISSEFPPDAMKQAELLIESSSAGAAGNEREDLTGLDVFTVDSPLTRDYDDALSVRELGNGLFEVGIHISDAAELVLQGTPLDREAEARASSIYLPDERVAMLPPAFQKGYSACKPGRTALRSVFLLPSIRRPISPKRGFVKAWSGFEAS